jgi:hypothetical protein
MKNGFFHSHLMCTSINAVIDESEQQEIISQKRSFDSNESSSSLKNHPQQRKYVSLSELNQNVEAVWNAPVTTTTTHTTTEHVVKSYNVVDLDDEVSSDNSGSNRIDHDDGKVEDHGKSHAAADEADIVSVEPSKDALMVAWSHIAKQMEEEIAQGIVPVLTEVPAVIEEDERTEGSDNSKCSFGYEKPIIKDKPKKKEKKNSSKSPSKAKPPPTADHEEVLKSLYETDQQPVLDKTPSKIGTNVYNNDEQFDNTTCTWSESADSTIPTVIYIRRDIPPVVPDDEALGQNYTTQQLRAIYDYTQRVYDPTNPTTPTTTTAASKSYLMKGLRFITLGAMGSKPDVTTPISTKMKKIHLDDDASEAFHQTLIDI